MLSCNWWFYVHEFCNEIDTSWNWGNTCPGLIVDLSTILEVLHWLWVIIARCHPAALSFTYISRLTKAVSINWNLMPKLKNKKLSWGFSAFEGQPQNLGAESDHKNRGKSWPRNSLWTRAVHRLFLHFRHEDTETQRSWSQCHWCRQHPPNSSLNLTSGSLT